MSTTEHGYQVSPWSGLTDDEETPELQWPNNVAVFDRMRKQDAQVQSVLRAVTLPIRRTTWRLDPNGARPDVVAHIAHDLGLPIVGEEPVSTQARARGRFSWSEHLRMALLMLPIGHSVFEQVYRLDDSGLLRLAKLGWRPPRTISKWSVASDGGLESVTQYDSAVGSQTAKIPISQLVVYANDREGGNWAGQSLLRPAYKFWLLKDRVLRVGAQAVDRNGMGIPVYEASEMLEHVKHGISADEAASRHQQEIKAGREMATALRSGANAGASIPHGAKLTLQGVSGHLPDAEAPLRYYDEQIARAVLAHFLNLGTETGSWALGSTFADFFTLSLQTVAEQVADTATSHIVEDLVDLNWGPDTQAPRVVFDEIGSRHPITAEAIKILIDAKAINADPALETFLRTVFGLPAADTQETA